MQNLAGSTPARSISMSSPSLVRRSTPSRSSSSVSSTESFPSSFTSGKGSGGSSNSSVVSVDPLFTAPTLPVYGQTRSETTQWIIRVSLMALSGLVCVLALGWLLWILLSEPSTKLMYKDRPRRLETKQNDSPGDEKSGPVSCGGSDPKVIDLNSEQLDKLSTSTPIVVAFVSHSCGACITFQPVYDQAASMVTRPLYRFYYQQPGADAVLNKYNIGRFPTVAVISQGTIQKTFDNPQWTVERLVEWIKEI